MARTTIRQWDEYDPKTGQRILVQEEKRCGVVCKTVKVSAGVAVALLVLGSLSQK